jgi:hypothetical protein
LNKKLSFTVENAEIVEEEQDSQFATAKIEAFHTGLSKHDTTCDVETLKRTASTIFEKPVIFEYDSRFRDFGSHSDKPIISGFIVKDSAEFTELPDGRTALNVFAKIWKKYAPKFLEVFKESKTDNRAVSVEMEVNNYEEMPDGKLNLLDFTYAAVCVLGEFVTEASPGSHIEMVTFAEKENKEYQKVYDLEFGKYEEIDLSIPRKLKRAAQKALDAYEEDGAIISASSLAMARFLIREEKATPEKIRQMNKFFNRKNLKQDDISYELFGGKEGARWSKMICEFLDDADSTRVSYFNSDESSLEVEDENSNKEEENMKKKKDEAVVEEQLDMAADPEKEEEKPEPAEEPKKEEEMAAPEKEDGEKKPEGEMAAPAEDEKPEPKEEMAADPEKKEDEEPEEEFSFGFSVDEAMAMMPEDDEKCSMARGEFAKGKDADGKVMMAGMFAAMQRMAAKCHAAEEEMSALKEFKAGIEAQQKQFAVDMTLKELSEKFAIPEETLAEMREDADKVEFAGLESWKTSVKAKSVDFAVIGKKDKEDVVRIGLVWNTAPRKAQDNLWVK